MSAEGKEMIDTLSKLDRIKDIRNRTIQVWSTRRVNLTCDVH